MARIAMSRWTLALLPLFVACGGEPPPASPTAPTVDAPAPSRRGATLKVSSPAFADGEALPTRFSCEGAGISPPVAWSDVPEGTESLVLIVEDPDVPDPRKPTGTFVHWVVYDLPVDIPGLSEGVKALPKGARLGTNDAKSRGWVGACPPIGRHRYLFRLYALKAQLGDLGPLTKGELLIKMQPHILGQTKMVGTYLKASQPEE